MRLSSLAGRARGRPLAAALVAAAFVAALGVGSVLAATLPAGTDPGAPVAPVAPLAGSPAPGVSSSPAPSSAPGAGRARNRRPGPARLGRLLRRADSVELEVRTKDGWQTAVGQRGTIGGVNSTSLVLSLPSGRRTTWTLNASTAVREDGKRIEVGDLEAGERIMVVGTRDAAGHDVARLIRCVREPAAKPGAPAPSPTPTTGG